MMSNLLLRLAGCGLAVLLLGAGRAPTAMTFDEAFTEQRRFSEVRFSPDGRHLLFSEVRDDASTGGLSRPGPGSTSYVADLDSGRIEEVRAPGLDAVDLAYCQPWSSDSRFAAMVAVQDGGRAFAYWDQRRHSLAAFGPRPTGLCGDWVGGAFIYRGHVGDTPGVSSGAEDGLEHFAARWRSAWNTARAEVTVHSNNPDFPSPSAEDAPEPTGLILADPVAGRWSLIGLGVFHTLKPAPDGRTFAVLKAGDPSANPIGRHHAGRQGELQIYRVTNAKAELLRAFPELDVGYGGLAWSPDGQRLLGAGRQSGDRDLGAFVVELASGTVTWLRTPPGVSLAPRLDGYQAALPLGWVAGQPAFIGRSAGALRPPADLNSDYAKTQDSYRLYGFSNADAVSLTDFTSQSVMNFTSASSGESLVVADGGLWAVAPGRKPRRIGSPDIRVTGLEEVLVDQGRGPSFAAWTGAGQDRIGLKAADKDGDGRLIVLDVATGEQIFSTKAGGRKALSPRLDAVAAVTHQGWASRLAVIGAKARTVRVTNPTWTNRPLGAAKHITYKVGDRTLDGWVILPPNYSGGRVPALVWVYGGRMYGAAPPPDLGTHYSAGTAFYNGQLWAAQGYAVIYPSMPIGRAFDSDLPKTLADAATAAVDAAAAAGWVDRSRAGVIGHSFGAYAVAAILAERSDRFKAGVAISGDYDPAAAWGARDLWDFLVDQDDYSFFKETRTKVELGQVGLQEPPWRAAEAYRRTSPFYQVATIKTPLMLIVGDLNLGATSLLQMERFYAALVREGNPAVAVRYWGQFHSEEDPGAVRDQWSRASAWFAHYLKPDEAAGP